MIDDVSGISKVTLVGSTVVHGDARSGCFTAPGQPKPRNFPQYVTLYSIGIERTTCTRSIHPICVFSLRQLFQRTSVRRRYRVSQTLAHAAQCALGTVGPIAYKPLRNTPSYSEIHQYFEITRSWLLRKTGHAMEKNGQE